jgi:hypothetical protein
MASPRDGAEGRASSDILAVIPPPENYARLIAERYRDCENHLAEDDSPVTPSIRTVGSSPSELARIASLVSLCDEIAQGALDAHGRLDEKRIHHARDTVVDDLLARTLAPCPRRRFSVIVTHDMDRTTLWECTALAKRMRRTCDVGSAGLMSARRAIAGTVDQVLAFEAEQKIRSIFFFLSGPYSLARYGSRTSVRWRSARDIIQAVKAAGMVLGLHGSYYARETDSYTEECRRLADVVQVPIRHHRNHYLRFDPTRIGAQLSHAGIAFDHSVGFTTGWGLRTGTCAPYPVYDLMARALCPVIAVPMLLMDGAWSEQFDWSELARIRALLERIRRHRGCVTLNFHPESLASNAAVWEYFRRIIDICHDLGAEMAAWSSPPAQV